jgi:hypothetical protein
MSRRVGLLYTDVSEERVRVEGITRARKSVRLLLTDCLQFGEREHWEEGGGLWGGLFLVRSTARQ